MRKRPKLSEKDYDKWADRLSHWVSSSVSPFPNDSAEKLHKRRESSKHDLLTFCETYLPHYFTAPFGAFHDEWEDFCNVEDEAAFLAAPREHGKSTFFSFAVPLWLICFQKKHFILIISDTNDQATGFTIPIKAELEANLRLQNDFGESQPKIGNRPLYWKKNDFVTTTGIRILARGHGEKVRGLKNLQYRPDFAVVDDFENDQNVENPRLIKNGMAWLRRAVIGSLGQGYTFIMVGNLFHPKSILSRMIAEADEKGHKLYKSKIYQAWLNYGKKNQVPIWPEQWSPERLTQKKRQMGSVDFNAEMMNLTDAGDSPFPENIIQYYSEAELPPNLNVATFTDPSFKNNESNDFKATVTVGQCPKTAKLYVLHAWVRQTGIAEMLDEIYRQNEKYKSFASGIEENMLHDFLHSVINDYSVKKQSWLPWMPIVHRTNKIGRIITTLQYLVEYGKLRFKKHHSDQDILVEQLIYLLNKNVHDDGPDALEGAVKLLQEHGGTRGIPAVVSAGKNQMAKTTAAYYSPISGNMQ